jgi:hypothetical protein
MLTQDKLAKALKQANVTAKNILAQGCTTDRGIAAQDAQRAVQEADEYLAAGDMLAAIMHDVTRFHTCVERVSGSSPTRWIGVVPLAVQRV